MANPVVLSLSGQSAVGQGIANDNGGLAAADHTLLVVPTAGVTGGVVTLMASMDEQTWVTTTTTVTTSNSSPVYAVLANAPFRYVAAKITTAITGGTVNAWVASAEAT